MHSNTENEKAFAFGIGTDNYDIQQKGMDLRDYFAAKALQGMLSNSLIVDAVCDFSIKHLTETSYKIADSFIEHRKK